MFIESSIADAIDFFHMDALSSAVAMKVDCDLVLALIAGTLCRHFASRIGGGCRTATFGTIFGDFANADERAPIPWLGGKTLRFEF